MRIRRQRASLFLLLLPSLALSTAIPDAPSQKEARAVIPDNSGAQSALDSTSSSTKPKIDVGTKNAPVDGKDGMPHEGPFITTDKERKKGSDSPELSDSKSLPTVKESSSDSITIDGKKIPESNDGVMDDPHRQPPKQGTTGTEGGVSEKDKARKVKEGETGERVENVPVTPNEVPSMPNDAKGKTSDEKESTSKDDPHRTADDVIGLEVRSRAAPERLPRLSIMRHANHPLLHRNQRIFQASYEMLPIQSLIPPSKTTSTLRTRPSHHPRSSAKITKATKASSSHSTPSSFL